MIFKNVSLHQNSIDQSSEIKCYCICNELYLILQLRLVFLKSTNKLDLLVFYIPFHLTKLLNFEFNIFIIRC